MSSIKKIASFLILFHVSAASFSQQTRFSIATDLSLLHNFREEQRFTVIGHTVQAQIHITPKEGIYAWFVYYSNGNFKNNLGATAKSSSTLPQQIAYTNSGNMRLKEFSLGYKKYISGSSESEGKINLYAYAGFGLLLGRIENKHSASIDTSQYDVPVLSGRANFKRLTIDPGIGIERQLGGDLYGYIEGRVCIPTDGYPSKYIYINNRAPWTGMLSAGLRVLF